MLNVYALKDISGLIPDVNSAHLGQSSMARGAIEDRTISARGLIATIMGTLVFAFLDFGNLLEDV